MVECTQFTIERNEIVKITDLVIYSFVLDSLWLGYFSHNYKCTNCMIFAKS